MGAEVTAADRLQTTEGSFFGLLGLQEHATTVTADVARPDSLEVLRGRGFDAVFHLAAQPISPLSNIDPESTMRTNVEGTANVGRAVAAQGPRPMFVFASSACWYGATTTSPLKEEDPCVEGEFKYSESKVLAEREVLKLEALYDLPTVRCRFVNLYGPGDRHFSRVIPKTIRHLINGEQPSLTRNDGSTILDYMHVEDAVSALIRAAEHGTSIRGEVFNFGIGDDNPRSAFDIVKLVSHLFDGQERTPTLLTPVEPRTKKKFLDSAKARRSLDWRPTRELDEGLVETIDWYRNNICRIEHLAF
jgi:CDP-glucose 4,6-dehydratase